MGGGPSKQQKQQLAQMEKERDARKAANDKEMDGLRDTHKKQSEMMDSELRSRNSALEKLRDDQIESTRRNDEELREKREEQERRAAELKAKQEKERATLKLETEAEKKRLTDKFDQQAADLKKEHDAEMRKISEQKEQERKRRDQQIASAEKEREGLLKKQQEDEKNHRKALEKMYGDHRKEMNKQWEEMNKQMEQHHENALQRQLKDTEARLAIVDENYARVRRDAIEATYTNIAKEFLAIIDRANKMRDVGVELVGMITEGNDEVPFELRYMNGEHNVELCLVEKQMGELKKRMKTCFDVSDSFKDYLMQPLEALEQSCTDTKGVSFKIIRATQNNNPKMLGDVKKTLEAHLEKTNATLKEVNSVEFRTHVEKAVAGVQQLSISR